MNLLCVGTPLLSSGRLCLLPKCGRSRFLYTCLLSGRNLPPSGPPPVLRPLAFPWIRVSLRRCRGGGRLGCRGLLGVSLAGGHNDHHISTYFWPPCLPAGGLWPGWGCSGHTLGRVCPRVPPSVVTEAAGLLMTRTGAQEASPSPGLVQLLSCLPTFHQPKPGRRQADKDGEIA